MHDNFADSLFETYRQNPLPRRALLGFATAIKGNETLKSLSFAQCDVLLQVGVQQMHLLHCRL